MGHTNLNINDTFVSSCCTCETVAIVKRITYNTLKVYIAPGIERKVRHWAPVPVTSQCGSKMTHQTWRIIWKRNVENAANVLCEVLW